ncbi:MAG: hypothetical protein R3F43_09290 [bacterium]
MSTIEHSQAVMVEEGSTAVLEAQLFNRTGSSDVTFNLQVSDDLENWKTVTTTLDEITFSSSAVVALGRTEVSATINTRYCRLLYAIGSSSTALLAASIRTAKN